MSDVQKAESLFRRGRFQEGLDLLAGAAKRNDPHALEALAVMALSGDIVRRDLPLSRDLFRRAAAAGSATAARAYRAFVANATGGPADWKLALALLAEAAPCNSEAADELELIRLMELSDAGEPLGDYPSEQVSEVPEAYLFKSLFTTEECDFLVRAAMPSLQPSTVVDPGSGHLVANPVRTSDAAAFPLMSESPAIHALCRRLAKASRTDVGQGEPLQVLHYGPGQEYRPHFDAIADAENQRVLTFLVYLNDDFEGGETQFIKTGLSIKGRKGDALLFRNADDDARPDPNSQHAGLPVTNGEKYLASRWIRQRALLAG